MTNGTVAQQASLLDVQTHAPQGQPCEACGCPVEPGDKFCPACGCPQPDAVSRPAPKSAPHSSTSAGPGHTAPQIVTAEVVGGNVVTGSVDTGDDSRHFRCDTCGAELSEQRGQRSIVCPFCESTYVVELAGDRQQRQRPEFIIGFAVTRDQAQEQLRRWLGDTGWFRPKDLRAAMQADRLKAVYLPFWRFAALANSEWQASIGEYWYRTETYTTKDAKGNTVTRTRQVRETEWWPLAGRHHRYHSGYLVSGSQGLPQQEALGLMPFNLPALKRFEPFYLAGWLCEEYSVRREQALRLAHDEFQQREKQCVAAFLPGDTYSQLEVRTQISQASGDLCLLPVYLLTYRYGGQRYRCLLNGQTGRLVGQRPICWRRVTLFVLSVVAVIAVLAAIVAAIIAAAQ